MSTAEHQTFIKTPKQLIAVVVLSFVAPVLLIVFLTQIATGGLQFGTDKALLNPDAVRARIQPVATVKIAGADGPKVAQSGEAVYKGLCATCHESGALKAPKTGDTAAWAKLIKEGLPALTADAIKGVGQMPPRGGNPDLSDLEVERAIVYMANRSGAKWTEREADAPKPAVK
jgi:cytochrome c5